MFIQKGKDCKTVVISDVLPRLCKYRQTKVCNQTKIQHVYVIYVPWIRALSQHLWSYSPFKFL